MMILILYRKKYTIINDVHPSFSFRDHPLVVGGFSKRHRGMTRAYLLRACWRLHIPWLPEAF